MSLLINQNRMLVLLLVIFLTASWPCAATGPSSATVRITPLAVSDQGVVMFKTWHQINKMGAHSLHGTQFGWLCVSSSGVLNLMLIADKVQNRKDFELFNQDHPRAEHLALYFESWLSALEVSEFRYRTLVRDLKVEQSGRRSRHKNR